MLPARAQTRPIVIKIKPIDGSSFYIHASSMDSIFSIKEQIMRISFIPPQQQRLVFKGKILFDEMTLAYYNISSQETLYLAVLKKKIERPKPQALVNRLVELINQLNNAPASKYSSIVDEISTLIDHPILKAAARINPEIQQILENAAQEVSTSERPLSEKRAQLMAFTHDLSFAEFESSPDGYRLFQSFLEEEEANQDASIENRIPVYTNVSYTSKPSSRELPNCWKRLNSVFQNAALSLTPRLYRNSPQHYSYFDNSTTGISSHTWDPKTNYRAMILKERFADQLNLLKSMGFTDEECILQALRETGGNVKKAEQLLRNRPRQEC